MNLEPNTNPVQTVNMPNQVPMRPDNYLVWTILNTIFCCWPLGIVSIIKACEVNKKYDYGDYAGALKASENAKKWSIWSAIIAGIIWFLYFFVIILAAVFA